LRTMSLVSVLGCGTWSFPIEEQLYWLWSPNPHFDVRLAGNIAIAGGGYRDLAHLANCSPGGTGPYTTSPACSGKDPALHAEARFRARF
jgi:hypothetical protein